MSDIIKRKDWTEEIKLIVKAVRSKKHSVLVSRHKYTGGDVTMTGWSGGSKENSLIVMNDGSVDILEVALDPNRFNDPYSQRVITPKVEDLPEGTLAVVKTGYFMGKKMSPIITFI